MNCKNGRIAGAGPETRVGEKGEDPSGTTKVLLQSYSQTRACFKLKLTAIKFGFHSYKNHAMVLITILAISKSV